MDNTISHRNQMILFIILFGIMTITGCSKDQDTKTAKTRDQILVDNMEHAEDYYEMNPYFKEAFEFLKRSDLADLPAGRHEIDGDRLFCIVTKDSGKSRAEAKLEAHRKYIDLHYIISGIDEMGWKLTATCDSIDTPYDADNDIEFFKNRPQNWTKVSPGSFAIFFPEVAHAPMVGDDEIHKIVLKIKLEQ